MHLRNYARETEYVFLGILGRRIFSPRFLWPKTKISVNFSANWTASTRWALVCRTTCSASTRSPTTRPAQPYSDSTPSMDGVISCKQVFYFKYRNWQIKSNKKLASSDRKLGDIWRKSMRKLFTFRYKNYCMILQNALFRLELYTY